MTLEIKSRAELLDYNNGFIGLSEKWVSVESLKKYIHENLSKYDYSDIVSNLVMDLIESDTE